MKKSNEEEMAMKRLLSVFILFTLFHITQTADANLLTEGSFEDPNIDVAAVPGGSTAVTGWTTLSNGVDHFRPSTYAGTGTPGAFGAAQDGLMAVDLNPLTYIGGGIMQAFATEPDRMYRLTFWTGTSNLAGRNGTGRIQVQLVDMDPASSNYGQTLASSSYELQNQSGPIVWHQHELQFLATGLLTELRFTNDQDSNTHFSFLDNVTVVAEPAQQGPEPPTNLGIID
jgi:hypothetical protein